MNDYAAAKERRTLTGRLAKALAERDAARRDVAELLRVIEEAADCLALERLGD